VFAVSCRATVLLDSSQIRRAILVLDCRIALRDRQRPLNGLHAGHALDAQHRYSRLRPDWISDETAVDAADPR